MPPASIVDWMIADPFRLAVAGAVIVVGAAILLAASRLRRASDYRDLREWRMQRARDAE